MMLLGVSAEPIQLTHEMCEYTALVKVRVALSNAGDGEVANGLAHLARSTKAPGRPQPTLSFKLGGSCRGQCVGKHRAMVARGSRGRRREGIRKRSIAETAQPL